MTATKPIKSNRKIFIWGLVAMLVIASIITTVVLVEKNSAAANGQTANGRESNGSDPNRSNNGGEGPRSAGPIPPAPPTATGGTTAPLPSNPSTPAPPTATGGTTAPLPSNLSTPFPPSNNNNNGEGVCSTRRIRKSWQELSGQEKSTFINALRTLKQMPSIRNRVNRYEDFVADHGDATRHAHSNSRFLPWHRVFLQQFENILRQIDASISLPYWDWGLDAMNPRASVVFSQDAFGGDGDPMSGCVVDGPFAGWSTTYQTPHCLRRRINGTVWTSSAQMAAFISATTDFAFFSSNFERTSHGQIHRQIGGDMFTTEVSANDPLFWVHHANVDRYFLIWQVQHPNSGYSSRDGILETDTLLPFNLPLSYGMIRPDQSVDYCYEYSSSVQPATDQGLALRKRSQSPARLELRYPPHLPDDWLRMMRFSVPETHAFEKRTERFTDLLNAVEFPAPSLVVEQQRAGSKGPIEWEPVKNPLWRFTTEDLAMLKEAWRVAGEMK